MNLAWFLAVATCHVARGLETPESPISRDARITDECDREMSVRLLRFSLLSYKAVADDEAGSFALASANNFIGMSQLWMGAAGLSGWQLNNVLHHSLCTIYHGLPTFINQINNFPPPVMSMRNAMFHPYDWILKATFIDETERIFHSSPQRVDDWRDIENGNTIHEFARGAGISYPQDQTFVGEESLVLAGAAKLSGLLLVKDDSPLYFRDNFYYNDRTIIDRYRYVLVTSGFVYGEFTYADASSRNGISRAQYIGVSWMQRNDIKTFIVMPENIYGINEMEKNINEATLYNIVSNTNVTLVQAILPKFIEMKSSRNLSGPLKNMHLTAMFTKTTDFARIFENPRTMVGPILDQVDIVYEWVYSGSSIYESPQVAVTFRVDHPFMILTVFKGRNPFILSMGRYGSRSEGRGADEVMIV